MYAYEEKNNQIIPSGDNLFIKFEIQNGTEAQYLKYKRNVLIDFA